MVRERERASRADSAVFEWLVARARARAGPRACAANAVRVPAGVSDLVADSVVCPCTGVILLVIGFSNLIHPCIPAGLEMVCT